MKNNYNLILLLLIIIQSILIQIINGGPIIDNYLQEGNKMTLTGSGFGNDPTLITLSMGPYFLISNSPTLITIEMPDSKLSYSLSSTTKFPYNGILKITVAGDSFDFPDVKIKPNITYCYGDQDGIQYGMSTYKQNSASVFGDYFYSSTITEVHMDNKNLSCTTDVYLYGRTYAYLCDIPPGVGTFNLYVINDGVSSDPYQIWYTAPYFYSLATHNTLFYGADINITIDGYFFQDGAFDKESVTIDGIPCIISSSTGQKIICLPVTTEIIPSFFGGPLTVKVDVGGQIANGSLSYTLPTIVEMSQIDGLFIMSVVAPNILHTNILINNQDIKSYCSTEETGYGDIWLIFNCDLPSSIKSGSTGNFTTPAYATPQFDVFLSPYVSYPTNETVFSVPTQGGQISIIGKYFEQLLLNGTSNQLQVIYNGNVFTNYVLVNNTYMNFNVPPGTGNLNSLYVRSIMNTTQLPFQISFGIPTITSYTFNNNIIELIGTNYGDDITIISLNYGVGNIIPVSDFQLTTPHTGITFELKGVLANISCKEFTITVDGLTSKVQSIVIPPIINSISLLSVNGGTLSFEGTALSQKTIDNIDLDWSLTIGGIKIDTQDCTITNTIVTCSYPPVSEYNGDGVSTIISLSIDQDQTEITATYQQSVSISSVIQTGQSLIINGLNFFNDGLSIVLNSISITSVCTLDSYIKITCPSLPTTVSSGQLVISVYTYLPASSNIVLSPYISSITPNLINSTGELITISGRFFESSSTLKVLIDDSLEITTFNLIDSTQLTVTIPYGIGSGHNVKISNNNGNNISTPASFSYYPPSVLEFTQTLNTNQFEIKLNNFSVNIAENLIYHNNQLISTIISQETNIIKFNLDGSSSDGELFVMVGNQKSNVVSTFLQPIIESLSKKPYQDGSIITVFGKYFSNYNFKTPKIQDVTMTFKYSLEVDPTNSVQLSCKYIDSTKYQCNQPKGYGTAIMDSIKVDGTSNTNSNTFAFSYQEPKVIQSTSLFYQVPGKINITVESFDPSNLKVFVEKVECTNAISISNKMVQCDYSATVPPNSNGSSLNITVISNSMVGKNEVFYYNIKSECLNQCSNHGVCNPTNGQCICTSEWQSLDCSQPKQPLPPPPVIDDNGGTILNGNNADINFTVSIAYLREIDYNGIPVKTLSMNEIQWIIKNKTSDIYSYFLGTFKNDSSIVELDVTYYSNNQDIDFAGDIISISPNSIKYIITISNFNFSSSLSSLQVIYNSQTQGFYDNGCELIPSGSSSSNTNGSTITNESVTWFQLVSGGGKSVMDAKFSRRMFVDSKVRMASVSILPLSDILYKSISGNNSGLYNEEYSEYYNRLTAITTPHFESSVILDPSFSSLLTTSDNDNECSENKWKTPVIAVLCSVGGAAIIACVAGFIYKKYQAKKFQNSFSVKLNKLK